LPARLWDVLADTPVQLWYAFAWAAAAALAALCWRKWRRWKKRRRHARVDKFLRNFQSETETVKILEVGPDISINDESMRPTGDAFVIGMPDELVAELNKRPGFQGNVAAAKHRIFGADSLDALGGILDIANVRDKIEPYYRDTVREFREEANGVRFNGKLFGVRSFQRTRIGPGERPYISLTTYDSDYFTFRIMDKFHRALRDTEPEKCLGGLTCDDDIEDRLYPFLVSMGLNFIVICDDGHIILTRRSRNLDCFGLPGNPIYPSFSEALSQTDCINPADRNIVPSVFSCFVRALHEELGIKRDEVKAPHYRLVVAADNGIGLGIYGFVETRLTSTEIVVRPAGRDRGFESAQIFAIPIAAAALNEVIASRDAAIQVKYLLLALAVDRNLKPGPRL
jgi:hypothetical protein